SRVSESIPSPHGRTDVAAGFSQWKKTARRPPAERADNHWWTRWVLFDDSSKVHGLKPVATSVRPLGEDLRRGRA
ncbi:MAG: hypothetical protein K2Q09_05655, partial [Phycisphaerales bacterium]|nr:hypothetical protein [Phycisphaerales bacterium]